VRYSEALLQQNTAVLPPENNRCSVKKYGLQPQIVVFSVEKCARYAQMNKYNVQLFGKRKYLANVEKYLCASK